MSVFKPKHALQHGCVVVAKIKGHGVALTITHPFYHNLANCRIVVKQLNGRNRGSTDIIGLGTQKGIATEPSPIRIVAETGKPIIRWRNIQSGEQLPNNTEENRYDPCMDLRIDRARYLEANYPNLVTRTGVLEFSVITREKQNSEIKFWVSVSPCGRRHAVNCQSCKNKTKAAHDHTALLGKVASLESDNISLRAALADSRKRELPGLVNKSAKIDLSAALRISAITSFDVAEFSRFLLRRQGKMVYSPRMDRLSDVHYRGSRPKIRMPDPLQYGTHNYREELGYKLSTPAPGLNSSANSFIPGAQPLGSACSSHKGKKGEKSHRGKGKPNVRVKKGATTNTNKNKGNKACA